MVLCSSLLFTVSMAAAPPPMEPTAPCHASACVQADDDPADLLEDIMDEYQEANAELGQKFRRADKAEQTRLREVELPKLSETYAQRVLKLTSAHPGTDVAWEGLSWIVNRARGATCQTDALLLMFKDFGKDERIGDLCLTVARGPFTADTVKALAKLIKTSPHKDVKGRATFALAMQYKGLEDQKGFIKQMSLVRKKYADVPYTRGTLGSVAEGAMFEVERLQIGMVAPDIKGADLQGVDFKLSDYRGKVVVLDFWGNW
jgi:hypothetical protein